MALACALTCVVGCTRDRPRDETTGARPALAAPATSATDARAWLPHVLAAIQVEDGRTPPGSITECWDMRARMIGYCGSSDPHRRRPALADGTFVALESLLGCSIAFVTHRPTRADDVSVRFAIDAAGTIVTTIGPQSILDDAGLRACVDPVAAAVAIAEAGNGAQTVTATLSYWYQHWCEDGIAAEGTTRDARRVVRVRDVKEQPVWNLLPEADGYTYAPCTRPERFRLTVSDGRVVVQNDAGERVGSVLRGPGGFVVEDASGKVLHRGSDAAEVVLEEASGKRVALSTPGASQRAATGDAPGPSASTHATVVTRRAGRYSVDWYWVAPDSFPARAAAVLADPTLHEPWQAAVMVFLAEGLDGAPSASDR